MINETIKELCPCGSGWQYSSCCGVAGRTAVNADVFATISSDGVVSGKQLTSELEEAIESLADDPDLYLARVNLFNNKAWLVKMSLRWYRESVFLDPGRMKGTAVVESELPWLAQISDTIEWQSTAFIFHTAFCGSTLMSQALEKVYNCLSLREPEALGSLLIYNRSQATPEDKTAWFERILALLSRRYTPEQAVVIKINDYVNPLMHDLLEWDHDLPILFMYIPFAEFLTGCLKADNRRQWIVQRYQSVITDATRLLKIPDEMTIDEDAYGEMAAIYWSYNIALFLQAQDIGTGQVKSLDFNDMLADPLRAIKASGKLFNLSALDDMNIETTVRELLGVYSKNSQFKYSPQQRRNDINKLIGDNQEQHEAGEALARQLLGNHYPENRLPGALLND